MAAHRAPRRRRNVLRKLGRILLSPVRLAWWTVRLTVGLTRSTLAVAAGIAWLILCTGLLLLSLIMGTRGPGMREAVLSDMLAPLWEGMRPASQPVSAPLAAPAPAPSTLARDVDPDPSLWPPMSTTLDTFGDEDEPLTMRAMRALQPA